MQWTKEKQQTKAARLEIPHVRWIATPIRAKVRHAARYERIVEFRDNGYVQGTSLCGVWRVWLNGEQNNDFESMHQCARCHAVITDDRNAEEFFGRDQIRGRR